MSLSAPYPLQLDFHADPHITRWRPLVQWLLAVPQLMIAYVLRAFRQVLTLISFFTVLFTEQVPRPLFDAIVMTYRFEWRAMSYALFMHEDYPPFDFALSSEDDGVEPHSSLRLSYPEHLERWKPLYKWLLAIPQYFVLAGLAIVACLRRRRRLLRCALHRGVPRGHQGLPGQRLPVRAPGGGLRRFPHRFLPALQLRGLRPRVPLLVGLARERAHAGVGPTLPGECRPRRRGRSPSTKKTGPRS